MGSQAHEANTAYIQRLTRYCQGLLYLHNSDRVRFGCLDSDLSRTIYTFIVTSAESGWKCE
jgi:hypothetical protein